MCVGLIILTHEVFPLVQCSMTTTDEVDKTYVCRTCRVPKIADEFPKRKNSRTGLLSLCHECNRARVKKWREGDNNSRETDKERRLRWKRETLAFYGGACACCGESDHRFLTFDHVNGGGREHRANEAYTDMLRWLRANRHPEGYQVLCWNCNSGRQINGGVCPHKDPRD